jgi:hypothetical protein
MSDAKKQVLDMIRKKQRRNKAWKERAAKRIGPYGIVVEFIKAMEIVVQESETPMAFEMNLEREANLMYDRFRSIDPEVEVTVCWNNEYSVDKWEDLQVEGVRVEWSRFYRKKHPLNDPTMYLDITQLFLEGYLDD